MGHDIPAAFIAEVVVSCASEKRVIESYAMH